MTFGERLILLELLFILEKDNKWKVKIILNCYFILLIISKCTFLLVFITDITTMGLNRYRANLWCSWYPLLFVCIVMWLSRWQPPCNENFPLQILKLWFCLVRHLIFEEIILFFVIYLYKDMLLVLNSKQNATVYAKLKCVLLAISAA